MTEDLCGVHRGSVGETNTKEGSLGGRDGDEVNGGVDSSGLTPVFKGVFVRT